MTRILIADPDPYIVSLATMYLERDGHSVDGAESLDAMARLADEDPPGLLILGSVMDGQAAVGLVLRLRSQDRYTPLIVLLDPGEIGEASTMPLYELADERLTKPFHGRELLARVRRLTSSDDPAATMPNLLTTPRFEADLHDEILRLGDVSVDLAGRTVTVDGSAVSLRSMEFELLCHLLQRPGRVCSREALFEAVWGLSGLGESRTVDVHMSQVRRRLAASRTVQIETIWGKGYKLTLRGEA